MASLESFISIPNFPSPIILSNGPSNNNPNNTTPILSSPSLGREDETNNYQLLLDLKAKFKSASLAPIASLALSQSPSALHPVNANNSTHSPSPSFEENSPIDNQLLPTNNNNNRRASNRRVPPKKKDDEFVAWEEEEMANAKKHRKRSYTEDDHVHNSSSHSNTTNNSNISAASTSSNYPSRSHHTTSTNAVPTVSIPTPLTDLANSERKLQEIEEIETDDQDGLDEDFQDPDDSDEFDAKAARNARRFSTGSIPNYPVITKKRRKGPCDNKKCNLVSCFGVYCFFWEFNGSSSLLAG